MCMFYIFIYIVVYIGLIFIVIRLMHVIYTDAGFLTVINYNDDNCTPIEALSDQ